MTTKGFIRYRVGYKYQLAEDYQLQTAFKIDEAVDGEFIVLTTAGLLVIKKGYAWDGISGPVADSETNMRASLVHDALYQLMRQENLDFQTHRKIADKLFKHICKEDGVPHFLASSYYEVLRLFAESAAKPSNKKILFSAPKKAVSQ